MSCQTGQAHQQGLRDSWNQTSHFKSDEGKLSKMRGLRLNEMHAHRNPEKH